MMGMLGVPLMSLVMSPIRAAAILLPVYVFSDMVAVWLYRRHFSVRNLRILIPAGCAGIALGWATASRVPDRGVEFLIGSIGLGYCFNAWRARRKPPVAHSADLPRGIFWGGPATAPAQRSCGLSSIFEPRAVVINALRAGRPAPCRTVRRPLPQVSTGALR
jgi:uncharacterized membrane protein YfcA